MDIGKARETDDFPTATQHAAADSSSLIPIDFAHLVNALERAQRMSAAAVAEDSAANRKRSIISDNALQGLEAMTPRTAQMPPLHCPANFHDRVAEIVRVTNQDHASDQTERAGSASAGIKPAVTES
jgi:hypothetical protein